MTYSDIKELYTTKAKKIKLVSCNNVEIANKVIPKSIYNIIFVMS